MGFKSGDCDGSSGIFQDSWKVQWSSSFSFFTEGMIFSPRISWYLIDFILPFTRCRFPVPEEVKQPQSITEPPPYFTLGRVFFSMCASFFLLQTYHWSIGPKSSNICSITSQNRIPKPLWLMYIVFSKLEPISFFCFWVSSGVRLVVWAWSTSAFSMHLAVETETSVPAACVAAGVLQSVKGCWPPASPGLWWQLLIAFSFCHVQVV